MFVLSRIVIPGFAWLWIPAAEESKTKTFAEAVARRCSVKKGVIKNFAKFTGNHWSFLYKNETLAEVFSCKFWEFFKKPFQETIFKKKAALLKRKNLIQFLKLFLKLVQRCSVKRVLLKISQNSQENTCARVSFLIKLQAYFVTFLRTHFL